MSKTASSSSRRSATGRSCNAGPLSRPTCPPRAAAGEPSLGALGFILHAAAHVEKATPSNGTPYSQRNVNRDMKRVLKLAKLPAHFSPHCLRHTFATLHLIDGSDPLWVTQQLGHRSVAFTGMVYGHWLRKRDQRAAARLAEAVRKAVGGFCLD